MTITEKNFIRKKEESGQLKSEIFLTKKGNAMILLMRTKAKRTREEKGDVIRKN